jgi:plastocyanin
MRDIALSARRYTMVIKLNRLIAAAALAVLGCDGNDPNDDGDGGGAVGTIIVGNNFFQSGHNGTRNPAIDTVTINTTVTWTWTNTGAVEHSVRSLPIDEPKFTSSAIKAGNGETHTASFSAAGTYEYDCAVHGSAMRGRIVAVE